MATRISQEQLNKFISPEAAMAPYNRAQQTKESTAAHDAALAQLITGKGLERDNESAKLAEQEAIANRGAQTAMDYVADERKQGRKVSASFGPQGAAISVGDAMPRDTSKTDARNDRLAVDYSKRLEKLNGFNAALDEVEAKTNRDGSGGVLHNADAKLMSTGGLKSAVPTSLLGIGELIGAVDKGTSDERKSLERLQLEYQKAMSGMRVTDQARIQEKQAMGWIASGDPALVAKGVRALAKNVQLAHKTIGAGYNDEVRGAVHSRMGDPNDRYAGMVDDNAPSAPPPGGGTLPSADAIQAEIQRRLGGRR